MTMDELRQAYLDFFAARGHAIIPSAPLLPENDPSTLFTSSGMQPLISYFLGEEHPAGKRVADSQKCFRAVDIDDIGDNRHSTFFEMLGNWSFGDYFKAEQLPWIYSFLIDTLHLDPERLYASVYRGNAELGIPEDSQAIALLQEIFSQQGLEAKVVRNPHEEGLSGRIFLYSEENWWSRAGAPKQMPAGEPGGPDSEIFYDFGPGLGLHEASVWAEQACHPNCDCGRFLEIGNSVFMQYQAQKDGSFTELPSKNIDFGGGLERLLMAAEDEPDLFATSAFHPLREALEALSGLDYDSLDTSQRHSWRIVLDHLRAAVHLIADGARPGSKGADYFVRRLLRRSLRHGQQLGLEGAWLSTLVPLVCAHYQESYPRLGQEAAEIKAIVAAEAEKFAKTLRRGLQAFRRQTKDRKVLTGELAFQLFETYGFPLELSTEEAHSQGIPLDEALETDFRAAKETHAADSRSASAGMFKGGLQDQSESVVQFHTATHLLHAALRQVLGKHVAQKGSNITAERLRFDFSHPQALSSEEREAVETQINAWVKADLPVHRLEMAKSEALEKGALAFFAEKYPEQVSVYVIGEDPESDFISMELCGGPHVQRTGEIGPLKLGKEKSSSAGVRRLYVEPAS